MTSLRSLLALAPLAASVSGCSTVTVDPTDPGGPDPVDPALPKDPDPDPDPKPAAFCAATDFGGAPGDLVLATWTEPSLRLVRQDGTLLELAPLEGGPSGEGSIAVISGGGIVAVTARWVSDDVWVDRSEIRWLTKAGVEVERTTVDYDLSPIAIGADGTAIMYKYLPNTIESGYVVRHADGSWTEFSGFDPYGEPLPGGWLAGSDSETSDQGFFDPKTSELRPLLPLAEGMWAQRHVDGFVYLTTKTTLPTIVSQTPDEVVFTELPGLPARGAIDPALAGLRDGFAMIQDLSSARLWRADIATGELHRADAAPPPGRVALEDSCGLPQRRLAARGGVIAPVRDGGAARLMLHDPAAGTFVDVGLPVEAAGTFEVSDRAGTFVIAAGDPSNSFCPIVDWQGAVPEGAIPSMTTQIARPSTGAVLVVDYNYSFLAQPSADGTCVAVPEWDEDTERWVLFDAVAGETQELPGSGAAFVWLE